MIHSESNSPKQISKVSPIPLIKTKQILSIAQVFCFDNNVNVNGRCNYLKKTIHNPFIDSKNVSVCQRLEIGSQTYFDSLDYSYRAFPKVTNFACHSKNISHFEADFGQFTSDPSLLSKLLKSIQTFISLHSLILDFDFYHFLNGEIEILGHVLSKVLDSQKYSLRKLSISTLPNMSDNQMYLLSEALKNLKIIKNFKMTFTASCLVTSEGIDAFATALEEKKSLTHLTLFFQNSKEEEDSTAEGISIARALRKLVNLEYLSIDTLIYFFLCDIECILKSMAELQNLKELIFHTEEKFEEEETCLLFAKAINNMVSLQKLTVLFEIQESEESFDEISKSIQKLANLEKLKLCLHVENSSLLSMSQAIGNLINIKILDMRVDAGCNLQEFCLNIMKLVTLRTLNLKLYQDLGDDKHKEILVIFDDILKVNPHLTELSLNMRKKMANFVFLEFIKMLDNLKNLEKLEFDFSSKEKIGNTQLIPKLFEHSKDLKNLRSLKLKLFEFKFCDDELHLLGPTIKNLVSLEEIWIYNNNFTDINLKTFENIIASIASLKNIEIISIQLKRMDLDINDVFKVIDYHLNDKHTLKQVRLEFEYEGSKANVQTIRLRKYYSLLSRKKAFEKDNYS